VLPGHLTQDEFETNFLMSKEVTIPTTWSEYSASNFILALSCDIGPAPAWCSVLQLLSRRVPRLTVWHI
jgi:hypothetical protein